MTGAGERADISWQKATDHRREAAAQDVEESPMAVIHSSHYAMFHAARAALFKAAGAHRSGTTASFNGSACL